MTSRSGENVTDARPPPLDSGARLQPASGRPCEHSRPSSKLAGVLDPAQFKRDAELRTGVTTCDRARERLERHFRECLLIPELAGEAVEMMAEKSNGRKSGVVSAVGPEGIEPTTVGLKIHCSAD